MKVLIWFRNDLRLHDHAPLANALQAGADILPVYCFDPRHFGTTAFGFPKTGAFRAQFLRESVQDLRTAFQQRGSQLIVRWDQPETLIPELAQIWQADAVYWHEEVTSEETAVETEIATKLKAAGITLKTFWGTTLYHPDDLPFPITRLPDVFTQFRKKV
jgi:deoxyribodipyrimidine photo-lyase